MYSYKKKSPFLENSQILFRFLFRLAIGTIAGYILFLLVKTFLFTLHRMENNFMAPTYKEGARLIVSYRFSRDNLLIGDSVFIKWQDKPNVFIGKIAGKPGDRIEIKNKKVFRNGNPINENSKVTFTDTRPAFGHEFSRRDNLDEIIVREKSYFLLCDNRDECIDSREFGPISSDLIVGKVVFSF